MKRTLTRASCALAAALLFASQLLSADRSSGGGATPFEWVVVQSSVNQNPELSKALADLVERQLTASDRFGGELASESDHKDALHVRIEAATHKKGNVAARLKFGRAIGQAYLRVKVDVWSSASPSQVERYVIRESTQLTGPHARRTGREDFRWLQGEVARQITAKIISRAANRQKTS